MPPTAPSAPPIDSSKAGHLPIALMKEWSLQVVHALLSNRFLVSVAAGVPLYYLLSRIPPVRQKMRELLPLQRSIRYTSRALRFPLHITQGVLSAVSGVVTFFIFALKTIEEGALARERATKRTLGRENSGDRGLQEVPEDGAPEGGFVVELDAILKGSGQGKLLSKIESSMAAFKQVIGKESQISTPEAAAALKFLFDQRRAAYEKNPAMFSEEAIQRGAGNVPAEKLREMAKWNKLASIAYCPKDELLEGLLELGYTPLVLEHQGKVEQPAYYLAYKSASKELVIGVRGTLEMDDVLTDILGTPIEVPLGKAASMKVHAGIAAASEFLVERTSAIVSDFFKGYSITIVGHSLGAGVAAVAGAILRERFGIKLQCISVAPPPCMDATSAGWAKNFVTGIVNKDDIIARFSWHNLKRLTNDIRSCPWREALAADVEKRLGVGAKHVLNKVIADPKIVVKGDEEIDTKGVPVVPPDEETCGKPVEELFIAGCVVLLLDRGDGQARAFLVDGDYEGLRRIELSDKMVECHSLDPHEKSLLEAIAFASLGASSDDGGGHS
mmetsp:Transcript_14202/g.34741  ORF Transcript_14202/g.34741 Transcript_14202/m.34741 type:complete len:557 (+) Transcript_14202:127-1797(+)